MRSCWVSVLQNVIVPSPPAAGAAAVGSAAAAVGSAAAAVGSAAAAVASAAAAVGSAAAAVGSAAGEAPPQAASRLLTSVSSSSIARKRLCIILSLTNTSAEALQKSGEVWRGAAPPRTSHTSSNEEEVSMLAG